MSAFHRSRVAGPVLYNSNLRVQRPRDVEDTSSQVELNDRLAGLSETVGFFAGLLSLVLPLELPAVALVSALTSTGTLSSFYAARRRAEGSLALSDERSRGRFGEHRLLGQPVSSEHRLSEKSQEEDRADTRALDFGLNAWGLSGVLSDPLSNAPTVVEMMVD